MDFCWSLTRSEGSLSPYRSPIVYCFLGYTSFKDAMEDHEKRRNWLNSTFSTMHFLVEFNHSNHSGFLNSITCWIQPIQPISSLMVVPEKTRLWVSPIFFSNEPLDQTLFLMKKFRKSKVTMFWKNWETLFFRQKPCWIG